MLTSAAVFAQDGFHSLWRRSSGKARTNPVIAARSSPVLCCPRPRLCWSTYSLVLPAPPRIRSAAPEERADLLGAPPAPPSRSPARAGGAGGSPVGHAGPAATDPARTSVPCERGPAGGQSSGL